MNGKRPDLPDFVDEAELDDDGQAIERLPELLTPSEAPAGLARLLAQVEELPLRYAPFYGRLSHLWDVPEAEVEAVLERARDPLAWHKPALPGLRLLDVQGGPATQGAETKLVRFNPGFHFPRHRHPGFEAVLVLEGSYTESSGRVVGPGDLHEMLPGSEHDFRVGKDEPCIAASVQAGLEFTGPVMRVLSKIFGGKS
jgi:quercetin dioxygenase-like cupin family protein